eukprot:superscaffoldBa00000055_g932
MHADLQTTSAACFLFDGAVLPAVYTACPCSPAALQGQAVCWETLRLVFLWTQQEAGQSAQRGGVAGFRGNLELT